MDKIKITNKTFLKVLGYLFLVLSFATAVTCVYSIQTSKNVRQKTEGMNFFPRPQQKQAQAKTAEFVDGVVGVSFEHDSDLEAIKPWSSIYPYRYFMKDGEVVSALAVPGKKYSGTNLNQAYAVVAVRQDARQSDCEKYWDGERAHSLTNEYQGKNEKFMYGEKVGAAAGTIYATRIFHVYRARTCYEINLNLSFSNIGNFPEGQVKPFDEQSVWAVLSHIVNTFKLKGEKPVVTKPENKPGAFCGGIAGKMCPAGYICASEGDYPDAGGICIKKPVRSGACIQVITKAVSPENGKTYTFPTPCDVPDTWEIIR